MDLIILFQSSENKPGQYSSFRHRNLIIYLQIVFSIKKQVSYYEALPNSYLDIFAYSDSKIV